MDIKSRYSDFGVLPCFRISRARAVEISGVIEGDSGSKDPSFFCDLSS